jgi:hypothetical protein
MGVAGYPHALRCQVRYRSHACGYLRVHCVGAGPLCLVIEGCGEMGAVRTQGGRAVERGGSPQCLRVEAQQVPALQLAPGHQRGGMVRQGDAGQHGAR